jgi:hypothetical protein
MLGDYRLTCHYYSKGYLYCQPLKSTTLVGVVILQQLDLCQKARGLG